jgi:hypothetical protein
LAVRVLLPTFLVIGAEKSGTTSLDHYLRADHPSYTEAHRFPGVPERAAAVVPERCAGAVGGETEGSAAAAARAAKEVVRWERW